MEYFYINNYIDMKFLKVFEAPEEVFMDKL